MMGQSLHTKILPFTILQESIVWDPKDRQFRLQFDPDESIEWLKDKKQFQLRFDSSTTANLPDEELALLRENSMDTNWEERVTLDLVAFMNLEKIAKEYGAYNLGIFGASFINAVHDDSEKDNYGKAEEHLQLGSLNIPTEYLGKYSIWSPRQYFYFSRARALMSNPSIGTKQRDQSKCLANSEVCQILMANRSQLTFLNQYEKASSCLFVRYEYIILYLIRNYDFLVEQRKTQLNNLNREIIKVILKNKIRGLASLIKIIRLASKKEDPLTSDESTVFEQIIDQANLSQFGNREGAVREELNELIFKDPERLAWVKGVREGTDEEYKRVRERIRTALEDNDKLSKDDSLKRKGLPTADNLFSTSALINISEINKLPSLDIPHQAYLRLLLHNGKPNLELAHMVIPVNHPPSAKRNNDPRDRYIKKTMFMLVSAYWDCVKDKEETDVLLEITRCLGLFIATALELLTIPEAVNLNHATRINAIRAAVAAIMSRNMSHNIGSHAIFYVVKELGDIYQCDMTNFLGYLQNRMDFIAQVSTSSPSWCLSLKLDNIIEEFNNQNCLLDNIARSNNIRLKSENNSYYAFEEKKGLIFYYKSGEITSHINGRIIKSTAGNVTLIPNSTNYIEINPCTGHIFYNSKGFNSDHEPLYIVETSDTEIKEITDKRDWGSSDTIELGITYDGSNEAVDIPHGRVGTQSFYSIMENLIRNAAKSPVISGATELSFTIALAAEWDNLKKGRDKKYWQVSIWDNLETDTKTVNDIKSRISQPIINEKTGILEAGSWGLKEIKICAGYLRLVRQEDIDDSYTEWQCSKSIEPPLLEVLLTDGKGNKVKNKGRLTYRFYILRPQEALVVGKNFKENLSRSANPGGDILKSWRDQGIDFLDNLEELRKKIKDRTIFRHHFLVIDNQEGQLDSGDWGWLTENLCHLPYRIMVAGEILIKKNDIDSIHKVMVSFENNEIKEQFNSVDEFKEYLWGKWVQSMWGDFTLLIRGSSKKEEQYNTEIFITESEDYNLSNNCYLVFDHRNKPDDPLFLGSSSSNKDNLFKSAAFHQSFKHGGVFSFLTKDDRLDQDNEFNKPWMKWRIKEAAAIRVGVLDERVYLDRERPASIGVTNYKNQGNKISINAWKKSRVDIINYKDAKENFLKFVTELGADQNGKILYDFFIIHQGIIDEIKKSDDRNKTHFFEKGWLDLAKKVRWIIITTGRGSPPQANKNRLRWVELSNLVDALIKNAADKLGLARLLFALQGEFEKKGDN